MVSSVLSELNINAITETLSLSRGPTLKLSSKRTLEAFRPLLTVFRISLRETPSTSYKKPKIQYQTFTISKLLYHSSILSGPLMN